MMRRSRWVTAVVVLLAASCSFTESDEISRPGAESATTSDSATTTTAKPSGAKPLTKLADGEVPKPGKGVKASNHDQLIQQLSSKKTASDLPTVDGRYNLSNRVIVASPELIDSLVAWGQLPDSVTTDITFSSPEEAKSAETVQVAQGVRGTPHGPAANGSGAQSEGAPGANGSMVIPGTGPLRLVVANASCCSYVLVRRDGAFSVEATRTKDSPDSLHVVAVPGLKPIAKTSTAVASELPDAKGKPIGKVAIPDMTMPKKKKPARPPDITDPPPSPEKKATVQLPPPVPAGSWCGYLALRGVPFDEAVSIWNGLGRPGHMDADGNGIPCETRY